MDEVHKHCPALKVLKFQGTKDAQKDLVKLVDGMLKKKKKTSSLPSWPLVNPGLFDNYDIILVSYQVYIYTCRIV